MEKSKDTKEMTPDELAKFINSQDEDTIISVTIAGYEEGGDNAGREDI